MGAENCEESDKQPSVVIKSYLKFCAVTESDVWQPTILEQWDQTFESEYYDETEDEISENEKLSDEWEDDVDNTPEVVDNDRKSRTSHILETDHRNRLKWAIIGLQPYFEVYQTIHYCMTLGKRIFTVFDKNLRFSNPFFDF